MMVISIIVGAVMFVFGFCFDYYLDEWLKKTRPCPHCGVHLGKEPSEASRGASALGIVCRNFAREGNTEAEEFWLDRIAKKAGPERAEVERYKGPR